MTLTLIEARHVPGENSWPRQQSTPLASASPRERITWPVSRTIGVQPSPVSQTIENGGASGSSDASPDEWPRASARQRGSIARGTGVTQALHSQNGRQGDLRRH